MITLLALGGAITFVLSIAIALVLMVGKNLIDEEIRARLERIPVALLRLVATRLPEDQREDLYEREWLPELLCHLRKAEGMPITRLVVGIKYSVSLFRSARIVARDLRGLSGGDELSLPPDPPPGAVPSPKEWEIAGGASTYSSGGGQVVVAYAGLAAGAGIAAAAEVVPGPGGEGLQ